MLNNDHLDAYLGIYWIFFSLAAALVLIPSYFGRAPERISWYHRLSPQLVVLVALLVRLLPAVVLDHGAIFDINSFHTVAQTILQGHDPYTARASVPYPPYRVNVAVTYAPYLPGLLWLWTLELVLSQHLHLPFVVIEKLAPVLADAAIAGLISVGLRRRGAEQPTAIAAGLFYAVNPVSILVSAYHGQSEPLPLLGILIAWYLLISTRDESTQGKVVVGAGLALGTAVLLKSWPVLLLLVFLRALPSWRRRLLLLVPACAVPAVATVAFAAFYRVSPLKLVSVALGYQSLGGWWGTGFIFAQLQALNWITRDQTFALSRDAEYLVIILAGLYLLRTRERNIVPLSLTTILIFYAVSGGFGVQYLMWIVPFLALKRAVPPWVAVSYIALSTQALITYYMGTGVIYNEGDLDPISLMGFVPFFFVYIVVVWWLVRYQLAGHRFEALITPSQTEPISIEPVTVPAEPATMPAAAAVALQVTSLTSSERVDLVKSGAAAQRERSGAQNGHQSKRRRRRH